MKKLIKQVLVELLTISMILPSMPVLTVHAESGVSLYTEVDFTNQDHLIVTIPSMLSLDWSENTLHMEDNIKVQGIKSWAKNYDVTVTTDTTVDFENENENHITGSVSLGTEGVETWDADEVLAATEKPFSVTILPPFEKEGEYAGTVVFDIETNLTEPDYIDLFTYTFDADTKTVTITGLTDLGQEWIAEQGTLYIPNHFDIADERYAITAIGDNAFKGNTKVREVLMEDWEGSLTTIGEYAFQNLSNCTSIHIADTVTTINYAAFDGDSNVTELTIPESVISIGGYAFGNWKYLENFYYNAVNATVDGRAFYYAGHQNYNSFVFGGFNEVPGYTLHIGENVEVIPNYLGTCYDDPNNYSAPCVKRLDWGTNNKVTLSNSNFSKWLLTSIDFPSHITEIPNRLCSNCGLLKTINIPSTITNIGDYAFYGDTNVTDIYDNTGVSYNSGATKSIYGCDSGIYSSAVNTTYHFGDNWVGQNTFSGTFCYVYSGGAVAISYINSVDWGNYRPTKLTNWCFGDVKLSGTLEIPDSVTTIDNRAFSGSYIPYLKLPASVTLVGIDSFRNSSDTTSVEMVEYGETEDYKDENMTIEAGNGALVNAQWLYKGEIIDRIENYYKYSWNTTNHTASVIGLSSLGQSKNLTVLEIPATVTHNKETYTVTAIGGDNIGVFQDNTLITKVIMPSITRIEPTYSNKGCFKNCTNLESVEISNTLTYVGDYAFNNCTALKRVDYAGTYDEAQSMTIASNGNTYFMDDHAEWFYNGVSARSVINGILYKFDFTNNEWSVLGFGEDATDEQKANLAIPDTINGHPVTSIIGTPFKSDTTIQSLSIGNNVTSLANYAFNGCTNLKSVTLGTGLTSLPTGCFKYTGLTSVDLSETNITTLNASVFQDCSSLKDVNIGKVTSLGQDCLRGCSSLVSIDLGQVTTLAQECFRDTGIKAITIPATCTNLGVKSFYGARNLRSVTFEEGLESVTGDYCFNWIGTNTVFTIPLSLKTVLNKPFDGGYITNVYYAGSELDRADITFENASKNGNLLNATWHYGTVLDDSIGMLAYTVDGNNATITGLTGTDLQRDRLIQRGGKLTIPATITDENGTYNVVAIGNSAFKDNSTIAEIYMEEGCTTIGDCAFYHMSALTKAHLADSITTWGDTDLYKNGSGNYGSTFYNCTNLKEVNIPTGVSNIPRSCFMQTGITSIEIPTNITTICTQAFRSCKNLTSVTIPSNVRIIGSYAFQDCDYVTEIYMEEGCETLCNRCFQGMDRLQTVHLADSITDWGNPLTENATSGGCIFVDCTSLTTANIPTGVDNISRGTFLNTAFTEFTIPSYIKTVGCYAFTKSQITNIYMEEGCERLCYEAFGEMSKLTTIHLADSITNWGDTNTSNESVGGSVFWQDSALQEVNIPAGVNIIPRSCFGYCGLTTMEVPSGIETIGYQGFVNNGNLTDIKIPLTVTSVKQNAFNNDNALATVIYEGTESDKSGINIVSSGNSKFINAEWLYNGGRRMMMSRRMTPMMMLNGSVIKELPFGQNTTLKADKVIYAVETIEEKGILTAETEVNVVGYVTKNDEIIEWVVIETAEGRFYINASIEELDIKLYSITTFDNSVKAILFENTMTYDKPAGNDYNEIAANNIIEIVGKLMEGEEDTEWLVLSDTSYLNAKLENLCTNIYEITSIEPIKKSCEEIDAYEYPNKEIAGKIKGNFEVIGTVTLNGEETTEWLYAKQDEVEGYINKSLNDLAEPTDETEVELLETEIVGTVKADTTMYDRPEGTEICLLPEGCEVTIIGKVKDQEWLKARVDTDNDTIEGYIPLTADTIEDMLNIEDNTEIEVEPFDEEIVGCVKADTTMLDKPNGEEVCQLPMGCEITLKGKVKGSNWLKASVRVDENTTLEGYIEQITEEIEDMLDITDEETQDTDSEVEVETFEEVIVGQLKAETTMYNKPEGTEICTLPEDCELTIIGKVKSANWLKVSVESENAAIEGYIEQTTEKVEDLLKEKEENTEEEGSTENKTEENKEPSANENQTPTTEQNENNNETTNTEQPTQTEQNNNPDSNTQVQNQQPTTPTTPSQPAITPSEDDKNTTNNEEDNETKENE